MMNARTMRALAEGRIGELVLIAGKTVVNAFKRGPSNRFEGVPSEQSVQSLRSRAVASRWISGSDASIGGMSSCSLSFEGEDVGEEDGEHEVSSSSSSSSSSGEAQSAAVTTAAARDPERGGFLKFTGNISLDCAPGKELFRTGYSAIRSPKFQPRLELDAFEGLRMRVSPGLSPNLSHPFRPSHRCHPPPVTSFATLLGPH